MDKIKTFLSIWWPSIRTEIVSLAQTFLAGAALYALANWSSVVSLGWSKDALVGLGLALFRAGVKLVWSVVEPQILILLQKIAAWKR